MDRNGIRKWHSLDCNGIRKRRHSLVCNGIRVVRRRRPCSPTRSVVCVQLCNPMPFTHATHHRRPAAPRGRLVRRKRHRTSRPPGWSRTPRTASFQYCALGLWPRNFKPAQEVQERLRIVPPFLDDQIFPQKKTRGHDLGLFAFSKQPVNHTLLGILPEYQ